MTTEPDYNAHKSCMWCHALRPASETIIWNGQVLCRDTDCLKKARRAVDVEPYLGDDDFTPSPDGYLRIGGGFGLIKLGK